MNFNPLNMMMQLQNGKMSSQQMINSLMAQNPQFNAILNQQKNSGMSMKDYTLQYAKQNNINIQPIIDMLRNKGVKF